MGGVEGGEGFAAMVVLDWDFFSAGEGGGAIAIFFGSARAGLGSVVTVFVSVTTAF